MKSFRNTLTQVVAVSVLALGASSAFGAVAIIGEVPKPSCDDIRKADETKCAETWHKSDQGKSDWLNYRHCMTNALNAWLDCIAPPPAL